MNLREKYEGTVCVVTGATSGNGEAVAFELLHLGAHVHALGRNRVKLRALGNRGAQPYRCDFANSEDIEWVLTALPPRVDYVFHLAGNAILGSRVEDEMVLRQTDLTGPVALLKGLRPRMSGGTVAVVTSASAGMDDIPGLRVYQTVKREMVEWWRESREGYSFSGINLMLISMGFIYSGIWGRVAGGTGWSKPLVQFGPGPQWFVTGILKDAAARRPVSYPGMGARLLPVFKGEYRPRWWAKTAMTTSARLWIRLVEGVNE